MILSQFAWKFIFLGHTFIVDYFGYSIHEPPKEKSIKRICFSGWSNIFLVNHYVFKRTDKDLIVFLHLKGQKGCTSTYS